MAEVSWHDIDDGGTWSVRARAADFLKGIVGTVGETVDGEEGWVRPLRFTAEQMRALSSCAAWHPALYRAQAVSCAGVRVELETTARRVAFEVTRGVGALDADDARDGFSVDVDDVHLDGLFPGEGAGIVVVDLSEVEEGSLARARNGAGKGAKGAKKRSGKGAKAVAREAAEAEDEAVAEVEELAAEVVEELEAEVGSKRHVVRLWLPYLSSCSVRSVMADADVAPVEGRRLLLVIGDSIAQGEDADDPGLSWPARLVREAGVDVLNQGLLGQVFQPSAVSSLAGAVDPELVWVALGANYRHEECYPGTVERDVRASLAFMRRQWRDCRFWVATPTPHDESATPSAPKSCWRELPEIVERVCERWPQFTFVDGTDLLDADPDLLADADHPNARGHGQMARRIARALEGRAPLSDEERADRTMPDFLRGTGTMPRIDVNAQVRHTVVETVEVDERAEAVEVRTPSGARGTARVERTVAATTVDAPIAIEADEVELPSRPGRPSASPRRGAAGRPAPIEVEPIEEPIAPDKTAVLDRSAILAASKAAAEAAERREARRKRTLEEDTEALLEILSEGPIDSVPLEQVLIRGLGTPTFVSEGFCSVDLPNGARILWGEDVIEARRVLSRQRRPNLVICLSAGLEPMVRRIFPSDADTLWYTLAVYEGTELLPVETDLVIEPLDNSQAGFVTRTYSYPGGINGAELAHMLSSGLVLGGYDTDDNLVGYIGEWREGAMGLLEVLPHARRRGYGAALESAKANEHLAQGWTPFAQIMDGNAASLRLQRALGLTLAAERQCYIPMT